MLFKGAIHNMQTLQYAITITVHTLVHTSKYVTPPAYGKLVALFSLRANASL